MAVLTSGRHISTMNKLSSLVPALVLLPFTVFSVEVAASHGFFGFVTLAAREPWALQMLLDLTIALFLVGGWIRKDARRHGIEPLPYLLVLPLLGSIGALAYLVRRAFAAAPAAEHASRFS